MVIIGAASRFALGRLIKSRVTSILEARLSAGYQSMKRRHDFNYGGTRFKVIQADRQRDAWP